MFLTDFQYFGTIGFIQTLLKQPQIIFDATAPFTKMSFKNRMVIVTSQGPLNLTIPIIGGRDQKTPLNEIAVDPATPWKEKHFKAIRTAYKRAPYFEYYEPSLELLYSKQEEKLVDFLTSCQEWLTEQLKAHWEILPTKQTTTSENKEIEKYFSPWLPKNYHACTSLPKYQQVFEDKTGFIANACILDMLFCCGPKEVNHLLKLH
ncbi:MAG: WbqC family protein [Chitinophagia bacterium]|jgi:hypothetical protein